jgi:thiosulfate dehydrogenase [quinone] large subunit
MAVQQTATRQNAFGSAASRATSAPRGRPDPRGMLDLPPARFLFSSVKSSPIWLLIRVWLGWQWLSAGWGKLTGVGYNNWITHSEGLQGFIAAANASWAHRAQAFGHPQVVYPWYLDVLNAIDKHAQIFSRVVTFSELTVGIGLILGCFTGIAAVGAVALNIMYITGGSAGPNGVFIALGVLLIAAWRVAGYLGADYFLFPAIGTPWSPGRLLARGKRRNPGASVVQAAPNITD